MSAFQMYLYRYELLLVFQVFVMYGVTYCNCCHTGLQGKGPDNFPQTQYDVAGLRASYPSFDDFLQHLQASKPVRHAKLRSGDDGSTTKRVRLLGVVKVRSNFMSKFKCQGKQWYIATYGHEEDAARAVDQCQIYAVQPS